MGAAGNAPGARELSTRQRAAKAHAAVTTLAMRCHAGGGEKPAAVTLEFAIELEDPVRGRKLAHCYRIAQLPVEG